MSNNLALGQIKWQHFNNRTLDPPNWQKLNSFAHHYRINNWVLGGVLYHGGSSCNQMLTRLGSA